MGLLDYIFASSPLKKWANHRNLYLLGLATIICGLGWSNALMTIGQGIIFGNWMIELDFQRKLNAFRSNKLLWFVISFYILHLIGLFWSFDLDYGIKDCRIKLPLIALAVIIGTSKQIKLQEWSILLKIYLFTLFVLTIASLCKYLGLFGIQINDKRELSIYISHIRYGLNLCFAVFLLFYFKDILFKKSSFLAFVFMAWFIACILLFELYTAFIIFLLIGSFLLFRSMVIRKKLLYRIIGLSVFGILILGFGLTINDVYLDFNKTVKLDYDQESSSPKRTIGGELYSDYGNQMEQENGVYINRFVAWKELESQWNKRSRFEFNGKDKKGQYLHKTVRRYMSSKGFKKDSVGVSKLSEKDIAAIENGITNIYYTNHGNIHNRIHQTFYEIDRYQSTGQVNNFSLILRLEYWKTAIQIIRKNFVFGVGTGDVERSFISQYILSESSLDEEYRRRTHNQYLSVFVALGLIGLLLFLAYLIYPTIQLQKNLAPFYCFMAIACISFLTEDTLETQAGVTFFALFYSLFLFGFEFDSKASK